MYQQDINYNSNRGFASYSLFDNDRYGNPRYHNIPHAVAVFEGNQNYASTGSKLDIKPLNEPQPASMLTSQQLLMRHDDSQMSRVCTEKGLVLPLFLNNRNEHMHHFAISATLDKTVYFEVTFSPP